MRLGIKVVLVEPKHPVEHGAVLVVAQVVVGIVLVPRIERVEPQHVQRLIAKIRLHHLGDVAIVPKRHMDVFQAAVWLVDSVRRLILRHVAIGILRKVFVKDNVAGPSAAHGKRVADNAPLRLAIQAEALAEIMDKASENHPTRAAVAAHRLGGLEQMFDLRQVGVRVAVVDQRVEKLRRLPDGLLALAEAEVLLLFAEHVVDGHVLVVEPVELGHTWRRGGVIDAKLFFTLAFLVAAGKEVVPLVEVMQWLRDRGYAHGVSSGGRNRRRSRVSSCPAPT